MKRIDRLLRIVVILGLAALLLGTPVAHAAPAGQATSGASDAVEVLAARLLRDFYEAGKSGDIQTRAAMTAPGFQTGLSNGEVYSASAYLDEMPSYEDYAINNLQATHLGDVLVTTYSLALDVTPNGEADFGDPGLRMTVFQRIDDRWEMIAHANYLAPELMDGAATSTKTEDGGTAAGTAAEKAVVGESANDELATELITQFFDAIKAGDAEAGAAMVAPHFQITRATGEVMNAAEYANDIPHYEDYAIDQVHATRSGDVIVATYTAAADTTFDGEADLSPPSLRLTVFQLIDGSWKMAAHANFAALQPAEAEPEAAPAAEQDDTALATKLVTAFLDSRKAENATDVEARQALLAPSFQIVRSSGEIYNAEEYASDTYQFEDYVLGGLNATRTGDVLVVSYVVALDTTLDGGKIDLGLPAPRLSVFQEIDGEWKMVAHANFAPLDEIEAAKSGAASSPATAAEPAGSTAAAASGSEEPAPAVSVSAADGGSAVELATGELLDVALAANPSTGYMWSVTANDETVLKLVNDGKFTASSDAVGAPGIMHFVFEAAAPGTVALELGLFPPGAETANQTYRLAVTVK